MIPQSEKSANSRKHLVDALAGAPLFRNYQRAFEQATGLPLTLRGADSWQLAHQRGRYQNRFCTSMSRASRSCGACLQIQQRVRESANGEPCTKTCCFGLAESAIAVKVGEKIVAYLQTGQVFLKAPTSEQTHRALERIKAWGIDLDLGNTAQRYNETQVMKRGEYQATLRLLQCFAIHLGEHANQLVLKQEAAEPEPIARARQFIETHHQEQLSLPVVSEQASMSVCHFCKRFKSATGLTYTNYLSRFRVEKAKNLLLNPSYRISEAAYEVGFQSLTHFNRVFKSVAGESPTAYRRRLPVFSSASKL